MKNKKAAHEAAFFMKLNKYLNKLKKLANTNYKYDRILC